MALSSAIHDLRSPAAALDALAVLDELLYNDSASADLLASSEGGVCAVKDCCAPGSMTVKPACELIHLAASSSAFALACVEQGLYDVLLLNLGGDGPGETLAAVLRAMAALLRATGEGAAATAPVLLGLMGRTTDESVRLRALLLCEALVREFGLPVAQLAATSSHVGLTMLKLASLPEAGGGGIALTLLRLLCEEEPVRRQLTTQEGQALLAEFVSQTQVPRVGGGAPPEAGWLLSWLRFQDCSRRESCISEADNEAGHCQARTDVEDVDLCTSSHHQPKCATCELICICQTSL